MNTKESLIFGIEGPAGSGKSTMANTVGREMQIPIVEGGRFYRQLTYAAIQEGANLDNTAQVMQIAAMMPTLFTTAAENNSVLYNGVDVTDGLRDENISGNVSRVSRQLEVRTIVEEQIRETVMKHEVVILVGRAVKKLFPNAHVLNVTIDPDEAERRHTGRITGSVQAVKERNEMDNKTAQTLGTLDEHDLTVDVTYLSPEEQAAVLRQFIVSHK